MVRTEGDAESIVVAPWPWVNRALLKPEEEAKMGFLQDFIGAVRTIRSEMNVPPTRKARVVVTDLNSAQEEILRSNEAYVFHLAGVERLEVEKSVGKLKQTASAVVQGAEVYVPLEGLIDLDRERTRLSKEVSRLENLLTQVSRKLENPNFVSRAPAEVVEKERQKKQTYQIDLEKIRRNLASLEE
jgi:valyl-tRNA synthetase